MFTDSDYVEYFGGVEELLKESIIVYTDILNEVADNAIKSKIEPMATENMEFFRFIRTQKEKFSQ